MSKILVPFLLAVAAITASSTLAAAEKASAASEPAAPGASPAASTPALPGSTASAIQPPSSSPEVAPRNVTPEARPRTSPSGMSGTPEPVRPSDPRLPGGPASAGPLQGRGPSQNDPLATRNPPQFTEGRVARPSTIRGVNTIDPLDGRPIGEASVWIFGLLADPAPTATSGSGDVMQQPLYLSFSSEENLRAFERADRATRMSLVEAARKNRMAPMGQPKQ